MKLAHEQIHWLELVGAMDMKTQPSFSYLGVVECLETFYFWNQDESAAYINNFHRILVFYCVCLMAICIIYLR